MFTFLRQKDRIEWHILHEPHHMNSHRPTCLSSTVLLPRAHPTRGTYKVTVNSSHGGATGKNAAAETKAINKTGGGSEHKWENSTGELVN